MSPGASAPRVTYTLAAWAVLVLFALTVVGTLAGQLVTGRRQKKIQIHREAAGTVGDVRGVRTDVGRALAFLRRALQIRETTPSPSVREQALVHIRSLDRKTGGPLPAASSP